MLFVYFIDTKEVVAKIEGVNNVDCEAKFDAMNYDTDQYATTYTPAFGSASGLIDSDINIINA
jgi:hypothetical protein